MKALGSTSPFGGDTQRYWENRRDLFSRFDEGISVDREGLYSAKPEQLAEQIAERLQGETVLDAFCGVGATAIAFARRKRRVIACDINPLRLSMASHNAAIYGVADKIQFLQMDARTFLRAHSHQFDSIYFDPAWGGPAYAAQPRFTLDMFEPNGRELIDAAFKLNKPFAFTLPKNFDLNEIYGYGRSFYLGWGVLRHVKMFATAFFEKLDD